jgi:hypothetical protein
VNSRILDQEMATGKRLRSGQNRETLKTLHWIQNTLADGDGSIYFGD